MGLRRFLPLSNVGLAIWAWRHRDRITDWAAFAVRAGGDVLRGEGLDDAKAELRLRGALVRDRRTRSADLSVAVDHGVAHLSGRATADVRDRVTELARDTRGVSHVDERVATTRRRRLAFP